MNVNPTEASMEGTSSRTTSVWQGATTALVESNGFIDKVTDHEILAAYQLLARTEGLFVEPISAAALAGITHALKTR